jgi:hypothetical protein
MTHSGKETRESVTLVLVAVPAWAEAGSERAGAAAAAIHAKARHAAGTVLHDA